MRIIILRGVGFGRRLRCIKDFAWLSQELRDSEQELNMGSKLVPCLKREKYIGGLSSVEALVVKPGGRKSCLLCISTLILAIC